MNELINNKNCKVDNRVKYGVDVGDIFYKYETTGRPYWGMHEYKVIKVGTSCMCATRFYVDLEFTDNDGNNCKLHASSIDLACEFSASLVDAWTKYHQYLTGQINHHKEIIANLKKSQLEAEDKLKEIK